MPAEQNRNAERRADLRRVVERFPSCRVLVIGDVMLDQYVQGDVERISPEAPVPVVRVGEEWQVLGGAGNVARNLAALGAQVQLVSAIGQDVPGESVKRLLFEGGITGHLLVEPHRTTSCKTRIIARNQQLVRVDREEFRPLEAQTAQAFTQILEQLTPTHHVVVVSDYGKGVISDQVMRTLRALRGPNGKKPVVLVDPKVVNTDLYADVHLLTPNAKEAAEMTGVPPRGREGVIRAGLALFKKLRCDTLCITLGAEGLAIFEQPDRVYRLPTMARKVFDVTGAGDTVIALLALGLATGLDLKQAGMLANLAASIVVGQVGTTVATLPEVLAVLDGGALPEMETWLAL